jgi:hypothetical protein
MSAAILITHGARRLVLATSIACSGGATAPEGSPDTMAAPVAMAPVDTINVPRTRLQMQNVDFYVDPAIPLRIRTLSGTIRDRNGGPVLFDDKRSFIIGVEAAEVGLTGRDLSLLLNKYVFNYAGSPLRNISISTSGRQIVQKGTLVKVFPMPFEIRADLSVTPDGRIRIRPTRTEILGLHVDKLMSGLGLALDEVINLKKARGASVSGNDIYLDPTSILPPPAIEGRISAVRVEGDQVVQTFGNPAGLRSMPLPDTAARNYMLYRGGTLRFGKLMMLDGEMQLNDLDPADPFRFDIDRYLSQLVAGYSRTLPSGGLNVFMRDIDKVSRPAQPQLR